MVKTCPVCRLVKPLDKFPKHGNACKRCKCDTQKRYYRRHREKRLDYNRRYYRENAEWLKAEAVQYRKENQDVIRDYRHRNRERRIAYAIAWRKANPDKAKLINRKAGRRPDRLAASLERLSKWVEKNPERSKEAAKRSARLWYEKNPERSRMIIASRRAAKKQATCAWGQEEIPDIYLEAAYFNMQVDHIVPLQHPLVCGLHVASNLQLLTTEENCRKRNSFDPEAFIHELPPPELLREIYHDSPCL